MTSKQRSNLKSVAANLSPIAQLGKGGVSENMVKSLSDALEAHELIKINVLTNAEEDAKALRKVVSFRKTPTFAVLANGSAFGFFLFAAF